MIPRPSKRASSSSVTSPLEVEAQPSRPSACGHWALPSPSPRSRTLAMVTSCHWQCGCSVEVFWRGKPYDGTIEQLDTIGRRALVAYDPPFDKYSPEWRHWDELRPPATAPPPIEYAGLENKLLDATRSCKAQLTYLSVDCRSWVLHVPRWHQSTQAEFVDMWARHPPTCGRGTRCGTACPVCTAGGICTHCSQLYEHSWVLCMSCVSDRRPSQL